MKLLLYCTKQPLYLLDHFKTKFFINKKEIYANSKALSLNGKIVAECDFEVEGIFGSISVGCDCGYIAPDTYDYKWREDILKGACLTNDEMNEYIPNYAIHIKNLNIFDKPRELNNYMVRKVKKDFFNVAIITSYEEIKNAPQNMMYCYGKNTGEKYILISIRPEYLVKILNKEKTIEVRKKVLKEMQKEKKGNKNTYNKVCLVINYVSNTK